MSYVVWDVSIMDELFQNFRVCVGRGMAVAIPIFAILTGISMVVIIIHKFVK